MSSRGNRESRSEGTALALGADAPMRAGCEADLASGRTAVRSALQRWHEIEGTRRLWRGDASLWSGSDEADWLGWLRAPQTTLSEIATIERIAREAHAAGLRDTVVLGMGGSSLFPDVLARSFGSDIVAHRLRVLDSTDPAQIAALDAQLDLAHTVFVVASKTGGTIEPNALMAHFAARTADICGADAVGSHFIAITDPGSSLEAHAREHGFRATSFGVPSIGGRFSALSAFGMLPAALLGLDTSELLTRADAMASACAREGAPETNPGAWLGVALGALAASGRDKLTLHCSPRIAAFGGWLEQLIAESSGKHGHGIVPVDGEKLGGVEHYRDDRIFVSIELADAPEPARATALAALARAGHPVIRITLDAPDDLAAEAFRWQIATAAACAVLGVNPFDQPDVEAAKVAARRQLETSGNGNAETAAAWAHFDGIDLFADSALAADPAGATLSDALRAHLTRLESGDYFAVNAFVAMDAANDAPLQRIRTAVSGSARVATTLGYGPRFLHSTGQLHKGGPANGVFLEVTAEVGADLDIPGQNASFGQLECAQALGDFAVLLDRGRRALRVHITGDCPGALLGGLETLAAAVERATTC